MERHILFFSNYCGNCKEFITELYKTPFYEKFEKVCVDKNRSKIPKQIHSVPAIIVPRFPRPMFGEECINWIRGMSEISKPKKEEPKPTSVGGEGQPFDSSNPFGAEGIKPYSDTMGGFSDSFSFIGNETPMEHSFSFLGQQNNFNIKTPAEQETSDKKSETSMAYERLLNQRKMEMESQARI